MLAKQKFRLLRAGWVVLAALSTIFTLSVVPASAMPVGVAGGALPNGGRALQVGSLTANHLVDPLGIDTKQPVLGWIVTSAEHDVSQTAYQIRIASTPAGLGTGHGMIWDSGRVGSAKSFGISYTGPALQPRTRYYWEARAWDNHGDVSAWSRAAWFETAFLNPSKFMGSWIGRSATASTPNPLLRKQFSLHGGIVSARAYISGIGFYKLYINGKRIGNHVLDPAFTDYSKTVDYVTYDVTHQLRSGANAVGVSLGNGWYAANADHFSDPATVPWQPAQPKVKFELDVRYADGTTAQVLSDTSWVTANGPTTADNVQSETYDARLAQPGWSSPGFNADSWSPAVVVPAPKGMLRAQSIPPIEKIATIKPVAVTQPKPGVKVYDFGITTSGWSRITMLGSSGTSVSIRYSEKINPDGTLPDEAGQTDTYIMKGGTAETYQPSWGWKGYRYVQVSTNPPAAGSPAPPLPELLSVRGVIVHTSLPSTGGFQGSSSLLNVMHQAMRNTILNNQYSFGSDTPVYEKGGWTADNRLYSESAMSNFGTEAYYENWMQDFNDAQLANGALPLVVPSPAPCPPGITCAHSAYRTDPVWESAIVFMHWYLYRYYGDVQTVRRDYSQMASWMNLMASMISSTGYIYKGFTFGDWSVPTNAVAPSSQLIGSMFLYESAAQLAKMAAVIGQNAGASHFRQLASDIGNAVNKMFYDPAKQIYRDPVGTVSDSPHTPPVTTGGYSQTANLLGLAFGLAPTQDRAAIVKNLADNVIAEGDHLATGANGSRWILTVLTEAGYGNLAYKIAANPTYPGWGHWFQQCGATTMWEAWSCTNARSHDHAFMGTIDDWFFTDIAGIESPTDPVGAVTTGAAWRKIRIKPYLVGNLSHASGHQTTPLGRVSSSWVRSHGEFRLSVSIPVGATARVFVPAASAGSVRANGRPISRDQSVKVIGMSGSYLELAVGSGTYQFQSETSS